MTAGALLEVSDLHVHFGESHILQGVSFSVASGGVTALLGRNGAGKTTTIRSILGLVARRGSVTLSGTELNRLPTHRIVRLGVGYVPEEREVFARLTVAENLRLAERDPEPRYELIRQLFPELLERREQPAGSLSGGEQQMLALSRALLNRGNQILLADEPTKGLSPLLVSKVTRALAHAAETVTVLLVEQNFTVAKELATTAVVLDQGRVVHRGSVQELMADSNLVHRYLGVAAGT